MVLRIVAAETPCSWCLATERELTGSPSRMKVRTTSMRIWRSRGLSLSALSLSSSGLRLPGSCPLSSSVCLDLDM